MTSRIDRTTDPRFKKSPLTLNPVRPYSVPESIRELRSLRYDVTTSGTRAVTLTVHRPTRPTSVNDVHAQESLDAENEPTMDDVFSPIVTPEVSEDDGSLPREEYRGRYDASQCARTRNKESWRGQSPVGPRAFRKATKKMLLEDTRNGRDNTPKNDSSGSDSDLEFGRDEAAWLSPEGWYDVALEDTESTEEAEEKMLALLDELEATSARVEGASPSRGEEAWLMQDPSRAEMGSSSRPRGAAQVPKLEWRLLGAVRKDGRCVRILSSVPPEDTSDFTSSLDDSDEVGWPSEMYSYIPDSMELRILLLKLQREQRKVESSSSSIPRTSRPRQV
ncbi:hypothetical protein GQ53DRAFT_831139 [Thozetella sp. PMI_491]|nr:hypothetical protein GQ53DRAFT_831139 [Thozetella sp. PMI_491]